MFSIHVGSSYLIWVLIIKILANIKIITTDPGVNNGIQKCKDWKQNRTRE